MVFYLLFECSAGYALFERRGVDEIASQDHRMQESWLDSSRFGKICKLCAFRPFTSPEVALENINDISEGILNPFLKDFLEMNIPQPMDGKEPHILGVFESSIGSAIESKLRVTCVKDMIVLELLRGIRYHFEYFLKKTPEISNSEEGLLLKTQRGLSHSYSRAKVKFNVNKSDNMIIQSISLLDQLDKDINTFSMRVREWYSWHFPELVKIVNDNILYARVTELLQNRANLDESYLAPLTEIVGSEKAELILSAAKTSMGYEVSEFDMNSVVRFATRVVSLAEFRKGLSEYLHRKMYDIAPNLTTLVGDVVGARLINKAGSLITLAKYPASTLQILGAEKALFRALKTRGNTPKYGLIFNSTFIGRAKAKDKGRISRYLANKCVIASRIDAFSETTKTNSIFGESLRKQVEDRLLFYENGEPPEKNIVVMHQAIALLKEQEQEEKPIFVEEIMEHTSQEPEKSEKPEKSERKVRKSKGSDQEEMEVEETEKERKRKSKKERKKRKKSK